MGQKTIREISVAWKEYKQPYVKQSTMAAYVLILENHILPNFGESYTLYEQAVQNKVLHSLFIFFQTLEKVIHSMNRLCKTLFCGKLRMG